MKRMLVLVLFAFGVSATAASRSVLESDQRSLELARTAIADMREVRKTEETICETRRPGPSLYWPNGNRFADLPAAAPGG